MKRVPLVANEAYALRRAETWLESVDAGFERANITAKDEAAKPLQVMDADYETWARAVRRGWHDQRSLAAASRVLTWLRSLEELQSTANRQQAGVTRRLVV